MKNIFISVTILILGANLFFSGQMYGQSPDRLSYQAILRNSSHELLKDQQVGMRISILQGSTDGIPVYIETQTPTTNSNGLISLEIGAGIVVSGEFSTIDWSAGPYFLKTETDPTGGTNYTITGTIQLVSVPYALYAKKAGNTFSGNYNDLINAPDLSGYITTETDPIFAASPANGISNTDITKWNNKLESYTETDPVFGASVAYGISQSDTAAWNNKLDSYIETDPVFGASTAKSITPDDTTKWSMAYDWGNHANAGYDPSKDSWTGDSLTYTMRNIGIKTTPTLVNLQLGKPYNNFFTNSFQEVDTAKDRTLMVSGIWEAGTHSKSLIFLGGNWVNPNQVTGSLTFASGAYENAAIQGREGNNTDWSGELVFLTRHDNNPMTEKMRITENGDVGIGTSAPSSKLTVNGTIETTTGGVKFPDGTVQSTAAPKHYIGELFGGGIVFYVYDNGQHGLIASPDDLDGGTGVPWGLSGTDVPNCESGWDGASNTAAIIAAGGAANEAAGLCYNYTGGGFTDWYLPSSWELNNLYVSAYVIAKILESDGDPNTNGLVNDQKYWSSTERDADYAFPLLGYDNAANYLKTNNYRVRAVRSF